MSRRYNRSSGSSLPPRNEYHHRSGGGYTSSRGSDYDSYRNDRDSSYRSDYDYRKSNTVDANPPGQCKPPYEPPHVVVKANPIKPLESRLPSLPTVDSFNDRSNNVNSSGSHSNTDRADNSKVDHSSADRNDRADSSRNDRTSPSGNNGNGTCNGTCTKGDCNIKEEPVGKSDPVSNQRHCIDNCINKFQPTTQCTTKCNVPCTVPNQSVQPVNQPMNQCKEHYT